MYWFLNPRHSFASQLPVFPGTCSAYFSTCPSHAWYQQTASWAPAFTMEGFRSWHLLQHWHLDVWGAASPKSWKIIRNGRGWAALEAGKGESKPGSPSCGDADHHRPLSFWYVLYLLSTDLLILSLCQSWLLLGATNVHYKQAEAKFVLIKGMFGSRRSFCCWVALLLPRSFLVLKASLGVIDLLASRESVRCSPKCFQIAVWGHPLITEKSPVFVLSLVPSVMVCMLLVLLMWDWWCFTGPAWFQILLKTWLSAHEHSWMFQGLQLLCENNL